MKEIIVIKQDWLVKDMKAGVPELDKLFICQKVEQVPETFDELKELCEPICKTTVDLEGNIRLFCLFDENDEQVADVFEFKKDGTIVVGGTRDEYWIAKKRTPAQMWQIIKALLGEYNGNKN